VNAKQKLDAAYARVEETSAELVSVAREVGSNDAAWRIRNLHKAARDYASAIRALAMRTR
jgi:hypothetical protein